jgi:cytoskeletal protein RodZ
MPLPEIDEKTEFTGLLLAQVRQARGLTLERISDITKINIFYLRAFENEKYADLPADVYVRGYLRQITNLLGLDSQRVVPSYLERMKKGRK